MTKQNHHYVAFFMMGDGNIIIRIGNDLCKLRLRVYAKHTDAEYLTHFRCSSNRRAKEAASVVGILFSVLGGAR